MVDTAPTTSVSVQPKGHGKSPVTNRSSSSASASSLNESSSSNAGKSNKGRASVSNKSGFGEGSRRANAKPKASSRHTCQNSRPTSFVDATRGKSGVESAKQAALPQKQTTVTVEGMSWTPSDGWTQAMELRRLSILPLAIERLGKDAIAPAPRVASQQMDNEPIYQHNSEMLVHPAVEAQARALLQIQRSQEAPKADHVDPVLIEHQAAFMGVNPKDEAVEVPIVSIEDVIRSQEKKPTSRGRSRQRRSPSRKNKQQVAQSVKSSPPKAKRQSADAPSRSSNNAISSAPKANAVRVQTQIPGAKAQSNHHRIQAVKKEKAANQSVPSEKELHQPEVQTTPIIKIVSNDDDDQESQNQVPLWYPVPASRPYTSDDEYVIEQHVQAPVVYMEPAQAPSPIAVYQMQGENAPPQGPEVANEADVLHLWAEASPRRIALHQHQAEEVQLEYPEAEDQVLAPPIPPRRVAGYQLFHQEAAHMQAQADQEADGDMLQDGMDDQGAPFIAPEIPWLAQTSPDPFEAIPVRQVATILSNVLYAALGNYPVCNVLWSCLTKLQFKAYEVKNQLSAEAPVDDNQGQNRRVEIEGSFPPHNILHEAPRVIVVLNNELLREMTAHLATAMLYQGRDIGRMVEMKQRALKFLANYEKDNDIKFTEVERYHYLVTATDKAIADQINVETSASLVHNLQQVQQAHQLSLGELRGSWGQRLRQWAGPMWFQGVSLPSK